MGTLPEIADLVVDLVRGVAAAPDPAGGTSAPAPGELREPAEPARTARRTTMGQARAAFGKWLTGRGADGVVFLEIDVRPGEGGYVIRHRDDVDRPLPELRRVGSPDALNQIARATVSGAYRPLRSLASLSPGWYAVASDESAAAAYIESLYPTALLHWSAGAAGTLSVTSFESWAERQSGIYATLRRAGPAAVGAAVDTLCAHCLRTRAWNVPAEPPRTPAENHPGPAGSGATAVVPCREPCTLFASVLRETAAPVAD